MQKRAPAAVSKSRYVSGLQCDKRLWKEVHDRGSIPPFDATTLAIFDQGTEVGLLATELFPGGIEIARKEYRWNVVVPATRKAMAQRRPLFEAAFRAGGAACRVDILNPVEKDSWDFYEVKSSTHLKDVHFDDVAVQAHVLRESGVTLRKCFLTHINTQYVRQGDLDLSQLFLHEDITEQVDARLFSIATSLDHIFAVLELDEEPDVPIGPHCNKPYACPLIESCWSYLPQQHVLTLVGEKKKGFELLGRGLTNLRALPAEDGISAKQAIQIEAAKTERPHLNRRKLRDFLEKLAYPLHYFDIETIAPALPRFNGTSPYQQIPFQYSLHIADGPEDDVRHESFLAEGPEDPRLEFLESLRGVISPHGSLVAYNAGFEKGILKAGALAYPEYSAWVAELLERFVDLLAPFRSFHYYHPDQLGSASIKAVLPALVGNSYKDLQISEGQTASIEFTRVTYGSVDDAERQRVRNDLEDYCAQDTLAMVEIVDRLRSLSA